MEISKHLSGSPLATINGFDQKTLPENYGAPMHMSTEPVLMPGISFKRLYS